MAGGWLKPSACVHPFTHSFIHSFTNHYWTLLLGTVAWAGQVPSRVTILAGISGTLMIMQRDTHGDSTQLMELTEGPEGSFREGKTKGKAGLMGP